MNLPTIKIEHCKKINEICEGKDKSFISTSRKDVLKFCRSCAKELMRELSARINFNTTCYQKYQHALAENPQKQELIDSLREAMTEAYAEYQELHRLHQRLANAKLVTTECVVCACVFNEY